MEISKSYYTAKGMTKHIEGEMKDSGIGNNATEERTTVSELTLSGRHFPLHQRFKWTSSHSASSPRPSDLQTGKEYLLCELK